MDLELLVIGATSAAWQGALAAAQVGLNTGIATLPVSSDIHGTDLASLPDQLLRDACADWPLQRPLPRRSRGSQVQGQQWRSFVDRLLASHRREQLWQRDWFQSAGGVVWSGTPQFLDGNHVHIGLTRGRSQRVRAQRILLATGTRPHTPLFARTAPRSAQSVVQSASHLLELQSIPQSAVVVGAGATGLRAAALLAWWGAQVTVIDGQQDRSRLRDPQLESWWAWAEELGVMFVTGEEVIGICSRGNEASVILESGRLLKATSVWTATQRRGVTTELEVTRAGIGIDEHEQLWCDHRYRTWNQSIYGTGDVVGFSPVALSTSEVIAEIADSLCGTALRSEGTATISNRRFDPGVCRPGPAHFYGRGGASSRKRAPSIMPPTTVSQ